MQKQASAAMRADLHTCDVTFDIAVACTNCALLATARCECVEMHSEEKVRRAGTRERVCMCAPVEVVCGGLCLCVCVCVGRAGGGTYCCCGDNTRYCRPPAVVAARQSAT